MHKREYVKSLIDKYDPDFVCLQETWLFDHAIKSKLSEIDTNYIPHGVSGMDEANDILNGRPKGGCAILWHQRISHRVSEIKTHSRRLCGVTVDIDDGRRVLIIVCYMPNDNMSKTCAGDDFVDTCLDLQSVVESVQHDLVLIAGDWNTDFTRKTAQTSSLKQFMSYCDLKYSFDHKNAAHEDTFYAFTGNGSSCIDFFLMSSPVFDKIVHSCVLWDGINLSPHQPVLLCLDMKCGVQSSVRYNSDSIDKQERKLAWHKASDKQLAQYQTNLDRLLSGIQISNDLVECKDKMCDKLDHRMEIDCIADELIQCCLSAAETAIPKVKKSKCIPKWNEIAKQEKDNALFWHSIWISCGRPNTGWVFEIRRSTRAQYHRTVKNLKKNDNANRCEHMADAILKNNNRDFWKEASKFKPKKKMMPECIDGKRGSGNIAQLFATKYDTLYNSVPFDGNVMEDIKCCVNERIKEEKCTVDINVKNVVDAIPKLKAGKHDGDKGLVSDHLMHSSEAFQQLLCDFINISFSHGHMAESLATSTIVSIPKDFKGSLINSDNYRGICLCSSIVKLIDIIMLSMCGTSLDTSDLQFAYKPGMSTVMCTTVLKEVVHHYNSNGSDVYMCCLDASKAFDRVRYDKLFQILLDRKFPAVYIKVLMDSYVNQKIKVRWGESASSVFGGINGVRQGGVISPILFTVYMDELITQLKQCKAGCWVAHHYYGALVYADDVNLLCPSGTGLQQMLYVCAEFGLEHCISFNEKKTVCIKFGCNDFKPDVKLNGKSLKWKDSVPHLGNIVHQSLSDEKDIDLKKREFYSQVNRMVSDFGSVNSVIIAELFRKYCNSFYGSQTWDLRTCHVQGLQRAWNKGVRRVLSIPFNSHCYLLPLLINMPSLKVQLMKRFIKMCRTMFYSKNRSIVSLFNVCKRIASSLIGRNLYHVCVEFNMRVKDILNVNVSELKVFYGENVVRTAQMVTELLALRDGSMTINGLTRDEVCEIINYVVTE